MGAPEFGEEHLGLRAFLEASAFFSPTQVLSPMVMSRFLLFSFFFRESRIALAITRGGSSMGVATFARRVLVRSALLTLTSVSLHSPPWNN